ncbi:MAG TPA: hypothetical protein VNC50_05515 [Planctomycetia bacterium]|nr:hypothetical protein [Planctomycetia bacterium]
MSVEERIKVACSECGAKLGVLAAAIGKSLKCPKCSETFVARPLPKRAPVALTTEAPDDKYALDEEADAPPAPARPVRPAASPRKVDWNQANGSDPDIDPPPKSARRKKRRSSRSEPSLGGAILRGALVSAVGAGIGALIWGGVAAGTGAEIGWLAWLIGGLAGGGMALGYGNRDGLAGGVAAIVAVLGVMVGKALVVEWAILPLVRRELGGLVDEVDGLWFEAFKHTFDPIDLLFFGLAIYTAYKVGSGGGEE